ncbi:MAG: FprA family A-type flavoprotein, partial [Clostridia bacterium]|nr:FprA family A-type flavoprotein [Clostridia bacterium]
MFKITEDIHYVGVDDYEIDLFEGQYVVPNGISYNSYVCIDEKIAVFDTVDKHKTQEWLKNLDSALKGKQPHYLIITHMEPDHSASIPAFLKKYPSAKVVGNEKTFIIFNRFFKDFPAEKLVVKEGDVLDLGKHKIAFTLAHMVHWPEVMMCYDKTDKILFSADAFGKFGALSHKEDWLDEARRYYINIVGKYGIPVQNVLKKAAALDIKIICPLHGPVLAENLEYYVNKYDIWSSYRPEEDGVLIAFASIYGNTAAAARKLADELEKRGVKNEVFDLNRCDSAQAVANAFKYSKLVIASITYDGAVMPCAESFINKLRAKNFNSRTVGFIQNGSWAPFAAKVMRTAFESFKSITFCETCVTVNSALDGAAEEQLSALAVE